MDATIERLSKCLSFVRNEINSDMALPQLAILLQVHMEEGITMVTLAKRLNMPQGSVSRNLKALGQWMEHGRDLKGYNLIDLKPDLYDRKRLACFLSPHGKEVCAKLIEIMEGAE